MTKLCRQNVPFHPQTAGKRLLDQVDPLHWPPLSTVRCRMTQYFLIDASGKLLTRDLVWTKEYRESELFNTPHKDIALNQLLELNATDIDLRARVVPREELPADSGLEYCGQ